MIKIAIFASGGGSNARKIIEYFKNHHFIEVGLVVTNNQDAGVINIAEMSNIPVVVMERSDFKEGTSIVQLLEEYHICFIILAGFLLLIPGKLIQAFPDKILNIHPSLLPKYGGKGMYGQHVHEKVKEMGDLETGMTIHLVDEKYDQGRIIFQEKCTITPQMNSHQIAIEVLKLEHKNYGRVIEDYIINF